MTQKQEKEMVEEFERLGYETQIDKDEDSLQIRPKKDNRQHSANIITGVALEVPLRYGYSLIGVSSNIIHPVTAYFEKN
jgi:hypothetical protein